MGPWRGHVQYSVLQSVIDKTYGLSTTLRAVELRHLRYFVAVGEALHFGRAAERLQIAQPTLSHQIRQLETELQTTLLFRTKRRVQLTEPGRLFLEEAREILAHVDRAAVVARRATRGEVGRLRVGFGHWMDASSIVAAVRAFSSRHPAIQVDLRTLSIPLQVAALREQRLDVGFVGPLVSEPSLGSEVLSSEPLVAALPARHRLAGRGRIRISALVDEPFILVSRAVIPVFYDLVLEACRGAGFVPHAPHEVDHPQVVLGLVGAGLGVSIVPASVRRGRPRGVAFAPLAPPTHTVHTVIAWRRDHASPLVAGFLRAARQGMAVPRRRG